METNKKVRIFLVNDNLFYLNIYEQSIKNLGYNDVSIFMDAGDCIDELAKRPDVIFLDHLASDPNSIDVLERIKKFSPDIYVVLVLEPEDIRIAINTVNYNVFDYIIKGDDEMGKAESILLRMDRLKKDNKKKLISFL